MRFVFRFSDRLLIPYTCFVASFPFYNVQVFEELPAVPVLLSVILVMCSLIVILFRKIPRDVFGGIDAAIMFYVVVAFCFSLYSEIPNASFVLFKTSYYIAFYLCLKFYLSHFGFASIVRYTIAGIVTGSTLFAIILAYVFAQNPALLVSVSLSYWGFTLEVYKSINALFGASTEGFESREVMRSTASEGFAFFAIFVLYYMRNRLLKQVVLAFNSVMVLFLVSRRAFLALLLAAGVRASERRNIVLTLMLLPLFLVATYMLEMWSLDWGRYSDMSAEARLLQYKLAIDGFVESPFAGQGYGAKAEQYYVHNFVLSSSFMMGIVGLASSTAILVVIFWGVIESLLKRRWSGLHTLLVVPIVGLLVGSTTEGIFSLISWTIVALYSLEGRTKKVDARRARRHASFPGSLQRTFPREGRHQSFLARDGDTFSRPALLRRRG